MSDYETRRLEKIKKNEALLAQLDIKPLAPKQQKGPPAKKKRKIQEPSAPARTSARIAAAPTKANYNDDVSIRPVPLPRSKTPKKAPRKQEEEEAEEEEPLIPTKNVSEIIAGWTAWHPVADPPTRDNEDKTFHFPDFPLFTPNKSPEEMLREGAFGGSYYRPLRSRKLGVLVEGDWEELPSAWLEGLPVDKYLTSPRYDADVNKFQVACGQSIEEWEAAGWIDHENDVRGWFQWYTRFFRGRRCGDDERQVGRWRKCVGETGRWRRMLLKKYAALGVREVFDDGAEEEAVEVSPVMHQTCHQWGWEIRQEELDAFWAGGGR